MQKDIFLSSEGDAWYRRNKNYFASLSDGSDAVVDFMQQQNILPQSVLEIGCADGRRLNIIHNEMKADCYGIDVSSEAIETGSKQYSTLNLSVSSADNLIFEDASFDLIIFGFCLYLCDRKDLFKIAAEADRILKDNGKIIIKDFHPPFPYKNQYSHCDNIYSYKMDYSRLFTWNPAYTLFATQVFSHDGLASRELVDERISLTLLAKNLLSAYPTTPNY